MSTKIKKVLKAPNGVEVVMFWRVWYMPNTNPISLQPEMSKLRQSIAEYVQGKEHTIFVHYEIPMLGAYVVINPLNIPAEGYLIN